MFVRFKLNGGDSESRLAIKLAIKSKSLATPSVPDYYPLASWGVAKMFARFKLKWGRLGEPVRLVTKYGLAYK